MLNSSEIFASKIVALLGRGAVRDLYDINNMIQFNLFNSLESDFLRKCIVMYKVVAGDMTIKNFNFEKIVNITERDVRINLAPMIRNSEKFDVEETKKRVIDFLKELLILNENEKLFLEQFSKGIYEPQLLFDDKEIISRIENHPMANLRIQNIIDNSNNLQYNFHMNKDDSLQVVSHSI